MNRYPLWKYIFILVVILLGALYALPNMYGQDDAVQVSPARPTGTVDTALLTQVESTLKEANIVYNAISMDEKGIQVRFDSEPAQDNARKALTEKLGKDYVIALNLLPRAPGWLSRIGAKPMYLGLDLRGGVHFLLQVDMKGAVDKKVESYTGDIRTMLRDKRVPYLGAARIDQTIQFKFRNADDRAKAITEIRKAHSDLTLKESTDGENSILTASLSEAAKKQIQNDALKQNIETLHNRVNELGVAEPVIQQQGEDRIVVQLPGVKDPGVAKKVLGRTATLEIRMVDMEKTGSPGIMAAAEQGQVPSDVEYFTGRGGAILVKKTVVLTGDYITGASAGIDQRNGGSVVHLDLNDRGARIFQQVTRENVNKRMAILLIEKGQAEVVTAPSIREEIGGGHVQIDGMVNQQEAGEVALLLRAGALAAPMDIVEERTVGPSMGKENIDRGFHSTLWGFTAVAILMLCYYWMFGATSVTALGANLLLLIALLSLLQATLTLPGLAAIALTLGMAIDANVLINERIREELRVGLSPQASIHAGYDRAFATILDSNVTTLIAGLALFTFGTGPIKGFAVVHVLGILTSMFTAVVVSRSIVNLIYGYRRKLTKLAIG
ncbi:MAG: protein translocase subunit SecD [Methylobacillus sp.]|jgi:preprotein translocase subunit SecD|nr:protein translocase subunit SecD [Methylobacillus sp.]